jgi:hypothetical protein
MDATEAPENDATKRETETNEASSHYTPEKHFKKKGIPHGRKINPRLQTSDLPSEKPAREVEKIIDRRVRLGEPQYFGKWKGFPESENTWEDAPQLDCTELIQGFKKHSSNRRHNTA